MSPPLSTAWKVAQGLFSLLFLFAAAVQYNDPDPLRWMALYLAAAGCCVAVAVSRRPLVLAFCVVVGVVAAVWSASLALPLVGQVDWWQAMGDYGMAGARSEEAREAVGLSIVAAWMAFTVARRLGLLGKPGSAAGPVTG